MGQSTNAYLMYGAVLAEDQEIVERVNRYFWNDDWSDDKAVQKLNKDIGDLGLELVSHCSSEYPMYILAIEGTQKTAWRGNPVRVELEEIGEDWDKRLKRCIEDNGLDVDGEIGWWLASDWC